MKHPIVSKDNKELRRKLAWFIKNHYDLRFSNNIVFVCGGNDDQAVRMRFLDFAKVKLIDYIMFTPELALSSNWGDAEKPFELTEFEELIGDLSTVIVVFPEAPGSFCETGYFVAKETILKKVLLAIDTKYKQARSFISLGPLHLVNNKSSFRPVIYTDYSGGFDDVFARIKEKELPKYKQAIRTQRYSDLSIHQKTCCNSENL